MKRTKLVLLVLTLILNVSLWSVTERLISRFERARPELLKAKKYIKKGKLDKAEKAIKICLKRMPEYAEAHYVMSSIYLKYNKLDNALESAKLAIDNYKYRFIIYRCFSDLENKASENTIPTKSDLKLRADKEVRVKNIKARYYFQYGNIFFRLKKYKNAYKQYSEAIKINPKYGSAYNNLANLYFLSKQYKKAQKYLCKAGDNGVKINKKFEEAIKDKLQ